MRFFTLFQLLAGDQMNNHQEGGARMPPRKRNDAAKGKVYKAVPGLFYLLPVNAN
jgi:hypothetical protein